MPYKARRTRIGHDSTEARGLFMSGVLQYRADIDGLRAVAVLSVLAFHLGTVPGGYVGVDIFFVISGFLISSIVLAQVKSGKFSLQRFYLRRIARIMPALFVVLVFCCFVALRVLFPSELIGFSKSLLWTALSVSNYYFWLHTSYFIPGDTNLLLHTWSLAVEEQFYILFPISMMLVHRYMPRLLRWAIVLSFVLSFVVAAFAVRSNQPTAFYMPYTRAWELLAGTLLALDLWPPIRAQAVREVTGLVGAGLVAYSIFFFSPQTTFPGPSALTPCAGAAAIIASGIGGRSMIGRVLALRPIVFVGLISYSLYLWHWPIIILHELGRVATTGHPRVDKLEIAAISMGLAFVSWRFVEGPFRTGAQHRRPVIVFTSAAAVTILLVVASGVVVHAGGLPERFPPRAVQVSSYLQNTVNYSFARKGTCFLDTDDKFSDYKTEVCLQRPPGKPNWLLLGDSHAALLWHPLAKALPQVNLLEATAAGCRPTTQPMVSTNVSHACVDMLHYLFHSGLQEHPVDGILMNARWHGEHLGSADRQSLESVIGWAKSHHVPLVILGPTPEYDRELPRLLAEAIVRGEEPESVSSHLLTQASLDAEFQKLASSTWQIPYISLYQSTCPAGKCQVYTSSGVAPIFGDSNHYSDAGASEVIGRLVRAGAFAPVIGN